MELVRSSAWPEGRVCVGAEKRTRVQKEARTLFVKEGLNTRAGNIYHTSWDTGSHGQS